MGRTYELTEDERLDLKWAARELDGQVRAMRVTGTSAKAWERDMKARWAAAGRSGTFISSSALTKAVKGDGGSHVADCLAFALGLERSRWRERRLAHELGDEPQVVPDERYPVLRDVLTWQAGVHGLTPVEQQAVKLEVKNAALKGEMTREIAEDLVKSAVRRLRRDQEIARREALEVDVKPDLTKLKKGKR